MAGDLPSGVETHAHTYGMKCPIIDCRWPVPGWDACVHPSEPAGDLPEGQQSTALAALVAQVMHKALDDVDEGWHLSCLELDADEGSGSCFKGHAARRMLEEDVAPKVVDAVVARVRADTLRQFAELMRVRAEEAPADEPAKWPFSAYALAAVKADEYASKGFPSAVEPRTPVSSPSDVDAPRDALTDQDFTDLRTDAAAVCGAGQYDWAIRLESGKGGEWVLPRDDEAHARQFIAEYASDTSDAVLVRRWVGDWEDVPVGALPEDEGTRPHPEAVCGCPVTVQRIRVVRHTEDCSRRQSAQRFIDAHFSDEPDVDDEGTRQEGLINVEE